jgi:hypothetical protein
MKKLPRG